MKITNKLIGIALTAIAAGALVACTNELKDPTGGNAGQGLRLAKNPDVIAWSGKHYLTNTKSVADLNTVAPALAQNIVPAASTNANSKSPKTRSNGVWDGTEMEGTNGTDGIVSWVEVETFEIDRESEGKTISEVLPEGNDNLPNIDEDFLYFAKNDIEFEFYPVHAVSNHVHSRGDQDTAWGENHLGLFYFDQNGDRKEVEIWSPIHRSEWNRTEDTKYITRISDWPISGTFSRGLKIRIPKGYKFGFFWEGKFNNHDRIEGDPEDSNYTTYYSSMALNRECYVTDSNGGILNTFETEDGTKRLTIHAGTFIRNNKTYMGIEDWTDFDYQDWVFAFDRIMDTVDSDNPDFGIDENGEDIFEDNGNEEICPYPGCNHPRHDNVGDGYCHVDGCEEPHCHPCPNIKEGVEHSGCEHPESEHTYHPETDTWTCDTCDPGDSECNPKEEPPVVGDEKCPVPGCRHDKHDGEPCPDCQEGDLDTPCNPCPKEDGPKCEHSKAHHDKDGYCDECGKDDPCVKPCPGTFDTENHEQCNHPDSSHRWDGSCRECQDGEPCYRETVTTPTGKTKSEVEVNLSVNDTHADKGINDLVAKLSIHVRHAGDVEIYIPMDASKYLESDDLYILNKHENGLFNHGGPLSLTYKVGGKDVTLSFAYDEHGITITTSGIDEEVFEYCAENYGDGINFEIYLYMNDKYTGSRDDFANVLNAATIKFLEDNFPDFYINAFTDHNAQRENNVEGDGVHPGWRYDCTVNIIDGQDTKYEDHVTGEHLNNSSFNWIYKYEGYEGELVVGHDHGFLWDPYAAAHPEEQ